MADLICVPFPTIMDGLVLRWYADHTGFADRAELASASRNKVSVYVPVDELPPGVLDAANEAYALLADGERRDEAQRRFATHRPARFLSDELVPIEREAGGG